MNFYARCLAFAMSTLAIAIMIVPIYQQTQAFVNKSNAVSDDGRRSPESSIIRSLADDGVSQGSGVSSSTRQLKGGPPVGKGKPDWAGGSGGGSDPEQCDASLSCRDDDEVLVNGRYMCKAVGQGTMVPTPAPGSISTLSPTVDPLALPKNIKNVCVPLEETVKAQLKGAICGCCAFGRADSAEDPQGSVNADNCPSSTCSSITPSDTCTLEDTTTPGYRMCKFVGKPGSERRQDVCVSDDESLGVQLKGGWCGCCGTCPPAPTPDEVAPLLLRTRQHASHLTIRDKIGSWKNGRSVREEIDSWKNGRSVREEIDSWKKD